LEKRCAVRLDGEFRPRLRSRHGGAWLLPRRHLSTKLALMDRSIITPSRSGTYVVATLRQLLDGDVAPEIHCNEKSDDNREDQVSDGYYYLRKLVRPTIAHFFASFQTLRRGMQHIARLYRWLQNHNSITSYDDGSPPTDGVHPDCLPERSQFLTEGNGHQSLSHLLLSLLWRVYCYCCPMIVFTKDSVHFVDPLPPSWPWDNDPRPLQIGLLTHEPYFLDTLLRHAGGAGE
jgi:hypothetical protein